MNQNKTLSIRNCLLLNVSNYQCIFSNVIQNYVFYLTPNDFRTVFLLLGTEVDLKGQLATISSRLAHAAGWFIGAFTLK